MRESQISYPSSILPSPTSIVVKYSTVSCFVVLMRSSVGVSVFESSSVTLFTISRTCSSFYALHDSSVDGHFFRLLQIADILLDRCRLALVFHRLPAETTSDGKKCLHTNKMTTSTLHSLIGLHQHGHDIHYRRGYTLVRLQLLFLLLAVHHLRQKLGHAVEEIALFLSRTTRHYHLVLRHTPRRRLVQLVDDDEQIRVHFTDKR